MCLAGRKTLAGRQENLNAETYGAMLRLDLEELAGSFRALVTYWEPKRLLDTARSKATRLIKYHQVITNILAGNPDDLQCILVMSLEKHITATLRKLRNISISL